MFNDDLNIFGKKIIIFSLYTMPLSLCVVFSILEFKGILACVIGIILSFIYFLMFFKRIRGIGNNRKPLISILQWLALRLIFLCVSIALVLKIGIEPLGLFIGLMTVSFGNKIYSFYIILQGYNKRNLT